MDIRQMAQSYMNNAPSLRAELHIPFDAPIVLDSIGHGEYNDNYRFAHPIYGSEFVLRINYGSQMHLDHQIAYEFDALKLLESSGRTPRAIYFDESPSAPGNGILVEEFHRGRPLCYETDLARAAAVLADIHGIIPEGAHNLLSPLRPLSEIVDESQRMFESYANSAVSERIVADMIRELLTRVSQTVRNNEDASYRNVSAAESRRCIINTELNSSNFLMIDEDYSKDTLVDWEKPIWGDAAQDIADFLAPTTTFWKTDTILSRSQMDEFVAAYEAAFVGHSDRARLNETLSVYLPLTCLRGITWCAMAFVEYQSCNRALQDQHTFEKIKAYLDPSFIEMIREEWY